MTLQMPPRQDRYLFSAYQHWAEQQGIPVAEGFAINLLDLELAHWPRLGVDAAIAHVDGKGDWLSAMVVEVPPGGSTEPYQHLFEAVYFVLEGRGSTSVELPDGRTRSFEWGQKSLFTVPLNSRYRLHNGSGQEPARVAAIISAPVLMNMFHTSEDLYFDNPASFPERLGEEEHYTGGGTFVEHRQGRHLWDTILVPDLTTFELGAWDARGAGGTHLKFMLADGTIHTHVSEMPVGRYKKAHRHAAGAHIFQVTGFGYSLLWYEGEEDFKRVPWEHGWLYAPPEMMFHQHFNTSPVPARYLAITFGNVRYPFWSSKHKQVEVGDVSLKQGGRQIEYEDEDPRIFELYREECEQNGVDVRMEQFVSRTS